MNFILYFNKFSCNRFFFPACNGEQYGNLKAEKLLFETALKIVKSKIKESYL